MFAKGLNDQELIFQDPNADVIAIDYTKDRLKMKVLAQKYKKVLQGNMDPGVLLGDSIEKEAEKIIEDWKDVPFVFNLGHGMWPVHKPESVEVLVNAVHSISKEKLI